MKLYRVAMVLLVAFMLTGCAAPHGTSPKGLEIPLENAAIKMSRDMQASGFSVVSTSELKKMLDEKMELTIISALPLAEDKQYGILPGAVNGAMPKTEMELTQTDTDNLLQVAGKDKGRKLVVYCGFVSCRRSTIAAAILTENGYRDVLKYPGGIVAWEEAGYPIEKK